MNTQTNTMTEAQQRAYDQAQVMLAFSQGKKIQRRLHQDQDTNAGWQECTGPAWNFSYADYRIAPEPQEVWLWVKEGQHPIHETYWHQPIKDLEIMGYTKKLFREVLP